MRKLSTIGLFCVVALGLSLLAAPSAEAACTATWICSAPYYPETISCSGTYVCESGPNFVTCDNVTRLCRYCPNYASCTASCDQEFGYCMDMCDDPWELPPPCEWECIQERTWCYNYCASQC